MEAILKFQSLLKELFQFEASDLDFGIYRIMNYKRSQIENFIERDLITKIESAFAKHRDERASNIDQKFEEIKKKIIQTLGTDAITSSGELKEQFKDTPLGREYLTIKAQKEEIQAVDEIKLQVFNDLYSFFSRYYEDGDFIPHYRYSIKGHKYAIPYNGEEVKLYWANSEQYYIKTGLLFRDYTFKADSYRVVFRTVEAREEIGSNKATKQRFFVLDDETPLELDKENKTLYVRFQYRELFENELGQIKSLRGEQEKTENLEEERKIKVRQEEINSLIEKEILTLLKGKHEDIMSLKKTLSSERDDGRTILLYHLNRFTAKNTKDYFIHKNLRKFLSEQLDYFIKSEVLSIETLEKERFLDKHITRAKVVREIGQTIIDFLAQIEDFQKRLWEKKKFVLKTEYVITTDRVPEEFFEEIWGNDKQKKEWEELGFEIPKTKKELKDRKLPVDTKYFSQDFKEKLLEKLSENADLDDLLDGLLIKSENYQALNLLINKYKEKVQTIYIDPPFNKEQDADYLYNVKYKDSTWISMLENRLRLARDLLNDRGSIFVRCDYNGNWLVRPLMNEIFGIFLNEIQVNRIVKTGFGANRFPTATDSLFYYAKSGNFLFKGFRKRLSKPKEPWWHDMTSMTAGKVGGKPRIIFGVEMYPHTPGRAWTFGQEKINQLEKQGKIRIRCSNCGYLHYKGIWKGCPKCHGDKPRVEYLVETDGREPIDTDWTDIPGYSFGWNFQTENSEQLLYRVIESTSNEGDLVMDFFLGSGTTTAVAHKLKRKWIGVEMGEHFWTVVLPRMKKVLAYDKSGISKEKDVKEKYNEKTAGGFFKYQIIEQYEDTLDNIELKENKQVESLFKDEYLLKYFLDFETRESPYLLNIENLKNPFTYKLKVNLQEVGEPEELTIDIPETFNYLLGLKVRKIKVKYMDRKYLFILGQKDGKDYAVVWREYLDSWEDEDFKKDKEFINQELKTWNPQVVYINGQSILTPKSYEVRYIEPEFKRFMEN
ncbi:site-specific DNA-methyltransferase [Thermodesulfovibrio yellowstonii]|uniref:site-specific DNA-methyltransferase (adenine-specific) n=1 Tax=Thermodesulfovibrio yellowstonii TaxID=28262 RepID=A0A9W6LK52_9BACT|nr:site-specific DNA-methyltransferase [Thermodesulfovibrio islandicus]GLI53357.1 site-specific DNA-methyltransferase [Thermodesulfovibrio islandicus]